MLQRTWRLVRIASRSGRHVMKRRSWRGRAGRRLQLGPFASMAFAFLAPLNASDFLRCSVALLLRRGYAATTKQKLNTPAHPGRAHRVIPPWAPFVSRRRTYPLLVAPNGFSSWLLNLICQAPMIRTDDRPFSAPLGEL